MSGQGLTYDVDVAPALMRGKVWLPSLRASSQTPYTSRAPTGARHESRGDKTVAVASTPSLRARHHPRHRSMRATRSLPRRGPNTPRYGVASVTRVFFHKVMYLQVGRSCSRKPLVFESDTTYPGESCMSSQGLTYNVDLVLCIDATGSMSPIIERVKANALSLEADFRSAMIAKDKNISALRVRVIVFRDVFVDGSDAFVTSDFFVLPDQAADYASFVGRIHASGGGDEPESGYEALALAMQSNWTDGGDRRRHVIVVWTDASPHPLERASTATSSTYPVDMPKNMDDLTDMWQGQSSPMDISAKRLVLFAPDVTGWNDLANFWDETVQAVSRAGEGLADHDYRTVLSTISESV